jgi:hypothetical protein
MEYGKVSILGTVIVIAILVIFTMLYKKNNPDGDLSFFETIGRIFGLSAKPKPEPKPSLLTKIIDTVPKIVKKPEVFNISENIYTYEQAPLVCEAYGAKLATYDQVKQGWREGANWCNYGWTAGQMATYPIQQKYWDELQKAPADKRDDCGKPGVNGGYFADTTMRLGVNCFGIKPEADPNKIVYTSPDDPATPMTEADVARQLELEKIRESIARSNSNVVPFSESKWSAYSTKTSRMLVDGTPVLCTGAPTST